MERANRISLVGENQATALCIIKCTHSRSRGGEGKLLDNDIVSPERDNKEDTEKASTSSQCNQSAYVLLRKVGQKMQAVHRRNC